VQSDTVRDSVALANRFTRFRARGKTADKSVVEGRSDHPTLHAIYRAGY
jgi:hypothetical protein